MWSWQDLDGLSEELRSILYCSLLFKALMQQYTKNVCIEHIPSTFFGTYGQKIV